MGLFSWCVSRGQTMTDINVILKRLEASRRELLDLSFRNKIINFRPLKAKGLDIHDEKSTIVFHKLYVDQVAMSFAPIPDSAPDVAEINEDDLFESFVKSRQGLAKQEEKAAERHLDDILQTPYVRARLERRLLNTYFAARSSIEEQGVNTLFFAIGMLHWADPADPNRQMRSPVVLLPVELVRKDVQSMFEVSYNGDELGCNVSLREKLKLDLGLEWPLLDEMAEAETIDIEAYFDQIEHVIRDQPSWHLDRDAIHLGFFSFHKYVMYRDLKHDDWPKNASILNHSIVTAILGDEDLSKTEPSVPDHGSLDDFFKREDLFHVVETDSSQAEALAEAASGKTMVIQGPPGTGKSQTITNLIAEAVARGKTVLFVAEKLAALDVVKRRLHNNGLGDIALEIYSNKTNKKDFIEALKTVWELGPPELKGFEQNNLALAEAIQFLNQHARLMNSPIGKTGRNLYQLMGRLMRLTRTQVDVAEPDLGIANLDMWEADEIRDGLRKAEDFQAVLRDLGVPPAQHPFRDVGITSFLLMDENRMKESIARASAALRQLIDAESSLLAPWGGPWTLDSDELDRLRLMFESMTTWPDVRGLPTGNRAWTSEKENLQAVFQQIEKIQQTIRKWQKDLKEEAWSAPDAVPVLRCLLGYQQNYFRWFSGRYRAAVRKAALLWCVKPPFKLAERIRTLKDVQEVQEGRAALAVNHESMSALFRQYWAGERSEVQKLMSITEALHSLQNSRLPQNIIEHLSQALESGRHASEDKELLRCLNESRSLYTGTVGNLLQSLQIEHQVNDPERTFWDYTRDEQLTFFAEWQSRIREITSMANFVSLSRSLDEKGLSGLVQAASSWPMAHKQLATALERQWCDAIIRKYFREHPDLQQFTGSIASRRVKEFQELDAHGLELNRIRVLQAYYARIPPRHGAGAMSVLNREFEKKKRHLPIRKLMNKAGDAIQRAKPVFMMSPFSVATYLPRGEMTFDLVIFDEASQVKPVDALGAIARGRQIVVVGDDQQLPPTNFFEKMEDDEECNEEESQTRDMESILNVFNAKGAFHKMLRWHYRSRHHTLIDFSNRFFYRDGLTVFPSPLDSANGLGLRLIHIPESVYLSGSGRARNPVEADHVAKAVVRHAKERPNESLGVAAFSLEQAREIMDRIEIWRRQNPDTESFFSGHPEEPFFVKNLENVQGDERDVIFISVGYGRNEYGTVSHNFGPLNKAGGERRLNVLVTRTRTECMIFSNITGDDIDLGKTNATGVRALKGFLQFARTGKLDLPKSGSRDPDSPFEEEVAFALRKLGYQVDHQVGTAGYFIDLGVKDPSAPGRYLLGIECDGKTYHSSRWARDRDRLRQGVLEDLGWVIHRIWSKPWFERPDKELQRVEEAIKSHRETKPNPQRNLEIFRPARQVPTISQRQVVPYAVADLSELSHGENILHMSRSKLGQWVLCVVRAEAPVHEFVVMHRILSAVGISRLGSRLRDQFSLTIRDLTKQGKVHVEKNFLWMPSVRDVVVRDRSQLAEGGDLLKLVCQEEIHKAFFEITQDACGIEKDDLFREVLARMGLGNLTVQRTMCLDEHLEAAVNSGVLAIEGERFFVRNSAFSP